MANQEQINILKQGVERWNQWRDENPNEEIDLSQTDFNTAEFGKTQVTRRSTFGTRGNAPAVRQSTFRTGGNASTLQGVNLSGVNFSHAALHGTNFNGANLSEADLNDSDLMDANLFEANLTRAKLCRAKLRKADLEGADLTEADLRGAELQEADIDSATLCRADLTGANLHHAQLVRADVTQARISGSFVYGIGVWDLKGEFAEQNDLVITPENAPVVTVDNLEVGQFIYLMLNNTKVRDVINTITSKGVLILGRFSDPQRKSVLDGLREKLREFDLLPIVFDFDRPTDKDYTETVQILAGMSMFVIADVTNPKSTPLELEATVKQFKIPFIPIIDVSVDPHPFAMLVDLQKSFHWVLPTLGYQSKEELLDDETLKTNIIDRAVAKREELRAAKSQEPEMILIRKKSAPTPPS